MRRTVCILFVILFVATGMAQSRLAIDRINSEEIGKAGRKVSFSALLEGTVDDPNALIYVIVSSPGGEAKRSFPAAVDSSRRQEFTGIYRWRAICQFGNFDGKGEDVLYRVWAVAIKREGLKRTGNVFESISEKDLKSQIISLKRTKI